MSMAEIIILGRGGQGAVTSAYVLAKAAFYDGKETQAFPFFGVERRGAPVMSFCRISDEQIKTREQIYHADYLIILDPALVSDVGIEDKVKEKGKILVNSNVCPAELQSIQKKAEVVCADATSVALEIIGKPFVNIPMLGAFAYVSNLVSLKSLERAIDEMFAAKPEIAELNKKATKKIYELMKEAK